MSLADVDDQVKHSKEEYLERHKQKHMVPTPSVRWHVYVY